MVTTNRKATSKGKNLSARQRWLDDIVKASERAADETGTRPKKMTQRRDIYSTVGGKQLMIRIVKCNIQISLTSYAKYISAKCDPFKHFTKQNTLHAVKLVSKRNKAAHFSDHSDVSGQTLKRKQKQGVWLKVKLQR